MTDVSSGRYFEFSEAETAMLAKLGCRLIIWYHPPLQTYLIAASQVVIENLSGPAVESLRRCLKAWHKKEISRLTPEWDSLIQLEV